MVHVPHPPFCPERGDSETPAFLFPPADDHAALRSGATRHKGLQGAQVTYCNRKQAEKETTHYLVSTTEARPVAEELLTTFKTTGSTPVCGIYWHLVVRLQIATNTVVVRGSKHGSKHQVNSENIRPAMMAQYLTAKGNKYP